MIYTPLTNRAMRIAYAAHDGQTDKCGTPYVFHPFHLAEQMPDEHAVCVALLHDVVEDTDTTLDELARAFPPEVIDTLRLLTHEAGVPYLDYVRSISVNPLARAVKRADLAHNLDTSRYAGSTPPPAEECSRRCKRYRDALAILDEAEDGTGADLAGSPG